MGRISEKLCAARGARTERAADARPELQTRNFHMIWAVHAVPGRRLYAKGKQGREFLAWVKAHFPKEMWIPFPILRAAGSRQDMSSGPRRGVPADGGARPEMGCSSGAAPGDFFYHFNGF